MLAGGHPRAAEDLICSIEASRDGEPFLSNLVSKLDPDKLSLATSSNEILCDHPVVIFVGLLGYEADPESFLRDDILRDSVYAQGALTRGVLDRVTRPSSKSASRSDSSSAPTYSTRMNMAFLLEVLKRKTSLPKTSSATGGRSSTAAVVDKDLYGALNDVRAALETGDSSMAWERFAFTALTAVSHARRICSRQLGTLVRDGITQPLLRESTVLDQLPASPPHVSGAELLEAAKVDASREFRGVRQFRDFAALQKRRGAVGVRVAGRGAEIPCGTRRPVLPVLCMKFFTRPTSWGAGGRHVAAYAHGSC